MKVYMYQAALYCEPCGESIRTKLTAEGKAPTDPNDECSYDSDDFPKGPFQEDEADSPSHCDACNAFLESPLTADGEDYVRQAILDDAAMGHTGSVALTQWANFYEIELPSAHDAGIKYANEQTESANFYDWVVTQMTEAQRMREKDPSSVMRLETRTDYRKLAHYMLQDLHQDIRRDIDHYTVRELSCGDQVSFFRGISEGLEDDSLIEWLTGEIEAIDESFRGRRNSA